MIQDVSWTLNPKSTAREISHHYSTFHVAVAEDPVTVPVNVAIPGMAGATFGLVDAAAAHVVDKSTAGLVVVLTEVMMDGAFNVIRVISQEAIRNDIGALAQLQAPFLAMTTGVHAPFDALMPGQYERMCRALLRSLGQLRFTHHIEVVAETEANRAGLAPVQALPAYNADQMATLMETALAFLWTTAQEKVCLDHGETPLPNTRSHRLAHYISTTCGSPIAAATTLAGNEGRTSRAITHEMAQTALEATYSVPQAKTRAIDAVWRHSLTSVDRHRFHDVALQEVPVGNGAYALKALVAADMAILYASALQVRVD